MTKLLMKIKTQLFLFSKNLFYKIFCFVPLPLVRILIPNKINERYCHWLVSRSKFNHALDAFVAFKFPGYREQRNVDARSLISARPVIVAGPPRVGKSTFSRKLAHSLQYSIFDTDTSRFIYDYIEDDHERHEIKIKLYLIAIIACKGRVVLEGATFLGDRKDTFNIGKKIEATLYIGKISNAFICILGCPNDKIVDKVKAIKKDARKRNAWVVRLSEKSLILLAQKTISRSVELKQYSIENLIVHYDINESSFLEDIENSVKNAVFQVRYT